MRTAQGNALAEASPISKVSWQNFLFIAIYLLLSVGSFAVIHTTAGPSLSEPLLIFAIVGVGFSTGAWLLTRRSVPLPFQVKRPPAECSLLLGYLLLTVWFLTWGLSALEAEMQREPRQMLAVLGAKLVLFVLVPLGLFCGIWKYKIRDLITASPARKYLPIAIWMSLVLIAFQIA
jgi:hypothetical protein